MSEPYTSCSRTPEAQNPLAGGHRVEEGAFAEGSISRRFARPNRTPEGCHTVAGGRSVAETPGKDAANSHPGGVPDSARRPSGRGPRGAPALCLALLAALSGPYLAAQTPPPPTVQETGELPPLREPPPFSDPMDRTLMPPPEVTDPGSRTVEILRHSCSSPLGHREVTLFANGTVRLKDGLPGEEWMGLAELSPEALSAAIGRLAGEDLRDAEILPAGVDGSWVERCELTLEVAGRPKKVYAYGRYDTLPLSLSRIVRAATDLSAEVQVLKDKEELPPDYEPQIGDVLKRVDGRQFEVYGFTGEGKGLEMRAVDDPLGLYILKDQLRTEFVAVVSRPRKR